MPGRLTTHVLDTAAGGPTGGVAVSLFRVGADETREQLAMTHTNDDGRTDEPLLSGDELLPGIYELVFDVGSYFSADGLGDASLPFLAKVPVRFGIADADAHYHVPLLTSPWAYSTYRGS